MTHKSSRYNHFIEGCGGGVLYNGLTGAIVKLQNTYFTDLQEKLQRQAIPDIDSSILEQLVNGGFVVDEDFDELGFIEEQYQATRKDSQFMITILPTFSCNLGCSYCFVGKKSGSISEVNADRIVEFVEERFKQKQFPSLSVDWFGGEPLISIKRIDYLSKRFISICEQHGAEYTSQVITNGTLFNDSTIETLIASKVDRLQITLDGLKEVHDVRRPSKAHNISPFDKTIEGIEKVIGKFLTRLRINVDRDNIDQVWYLFELFQRKGWLEEGKHFYPYLARISPFTEACSTVSENTVPIEEFEAVNLAWIKRLNEAQLDVSFKALYGFPEPKLYNCSAVGENGFLFTSNGEIHKCGLTVDDSLEAVGKLGEAIDFTTKNSMKWKKWSPLDNPICRGCEFLPSCLGGCPRNQIENREIQKKENCTYYQGFENKILKTHLEIGGII